MSTLTDEETSLVCKTDAVPETVTVCEPGWAMFRIVGQLDFSLIGILAKMSEILANASVGIFVVSTYNTDYVLVKETQLERAVQALTSAGYGII